MARYYNKFFKSLYWKLSAVFLILLSLVGAAYISLTLFSTEMYFAETSQRLNASLAQHIVEETQPFIDGKPNVESLNKLFHNVMIVNPSVEVYLLDAQGRVLTYDAPADKIKLPSVSLDPIVEFLRSGGKKLVLGANPRDAQRPKVFSAAPVVVNGMIAGYVYVILGGEEYDSIAERIQQSHILALGLRGFLLSLIAAGVIGLAALAFVTRKLRRMTRTVTIFKSGDYAQRIPITSNDEIDELGSAFNDMAETIQRNVDELNKADVLRRDLIANVSHDLRTPLASTQGYIETILMKNETLTTEERGKYLKIILNSTERLSRLVEELFELSKFEARQIVLKPEPFSMTELVNDVAAKFAPQAEKAGVSIATDLPAQLPLAHGDIGMIERVMQNLIENAVKYTPAGGTIRISVGLHNRRIRVEIADTGAGIDEKDLPYIFDRFYQARSREKLPGSAGLGLAIAKKTLEAHGEAISVKSTLNRGTTFTFELPAATN